jgi:YfiH family protein
MPNTTLKSRRRSRSALKQGRGAWAEERRAGIRVLQAGLLNRQPWLVHGFSTRPGGESVLDGKKVLNLGVAEWDARERVLANRKRFLEALGAEDFALVPLRQVHSDVVHVFKAAPEAPCCGDASITNTPGLLLAVQTADCVPILLADPVKRVVAAVHAGWRGTLERIVMKTIGRMQMDYGTRPGNLLAALGPAIGGCCYEVGTEVAQAFAAQFARAAEWFDELRTGDEPNPLQWLSMAPPGHNPPPKKVRLNLHAANRWQLTEAGVQPENITASDLCTACRTDLLFSYRREGPRSGRLMSVIGLRKK